MHACPGLSTCGSSAPASFPLHACPPTHPPTPRRRLATLRGELAAQVAAAAQAAGEVVALQRDGVAAAERHAAAEEAMKVCGVQSLGVEGGGGGQGERG